MPQFNTTVLQRVNTFVLANEFYTPDNSAMTLAERIAAARKHAGFNQEELADKAGCTQDMISKLENGVRKKTSHIVKIARACGVSVDWLDSGEGEMLEHAVYARDAKEVKALVVMQQMSEYQKDTAIKILNTLAEPATGTDGPGTTKQ